MGTEPMELAKNWDPKHWKKVLPAYAEIKYDGVPLTFTRPADGGPVQALTRQNEVALSVPHLLEVAELILLTPGSSFTAECLVPGLPFKTASGIIRRKVPDQDTKFIMGIIFDANLMAQPRTTYAIRIQQAEAALDPIALEHLSKHGKNCGFVVAPRLLVETVEAVDHTWEVIKVLSENIHKTEPEGMMLHSLTKPFQPGKRCWGMSRYKPQPTIDLEVAGFEEAVSEAGEGLGMVGRVNVRLRRVWPLASVPAGWTVLAHALPDPKMALAEKIVGVGPGKLTHEDRIGWWNDYNVGALGATNLFAEIKYMPDPTYEALRQPTIQRFRTDKTEGDILEY